MSRQLTVAHLWMAVALSLWSGAPEAVWFWAGLVWLTTSALLIGTAFPECRRGETLAAAQKRCWLSLRGSTACSGGMAVVLLLLLRAINGGRELVYDPLNELWEFSPPYWPHWPSSIVPGAAWRAVALGCALVASFWLARYFWSKRQRLLFMQGLSIISALAAAPLIGWCFWENSPDWLYLVAAGPVTVGSANFILPTAVCAGLVGEAMVSGRKLTWWLSLAVALNLAGAMLGASTLVVGAVVVLVGTTAIYVWGRQGAPAWRICGTTALLALALTLFFYVCHYGDPLSQKIVLKTALAGGDAVVEGTPVAKRLWGDYYWLGAGAEGFAKLAPFYGWTPSLVVKGAGADYMWYLCEHGLVGAVLVVLMFAGVLWETGRRLALLPLVVGTTQTPVARFWVFRIHPLALLLLAALLATVVAGCVEVVFHKPAAALAWVIVLGCVGSFLPIRKAI